MDEQIQHHVEKLLQYMRDEAYKPLTVQELEEAFGIEDAADFKDFVKALVYMEEKGLVVRTRSNRYGVPEKMNLVRGRFTAHAKGYAFVVPEEPGIDDLFIPPGETGDAMHGDLVLARVSTERFSSGGKERSSASLKGRQHILSAHMWTANISDLSFLMTKGSPMTSLSRKMLSTEPSKATKSS